MTNRNTEPFDTDGRTDAPETSGALARVGSLPLRDGLLFGLLAFVVGYAATLVLARVGGGLTGVRDPFALVGVVFYSAHLVSSTLSGPTGVQAVNALADLTSTLPKPVYYLVPVVALAGAGYLLVDRLPADGRSPRAGAVAGAAVVVGYLPLVVVGAELFTVSLTGGTPFGTLTWRSDLVSAVVLAGLVYPLAFGALGGYLAVLRPSGRRSGTSDEAVTTVDQPTR